MALVVDGIAGVLGLAGRDLGHSPWREVTQELVEKFASVCGDHQWIHTDVARAAQGPFGGTIAHGFMVLAWGVPMSAELLRVTGVGMALNYGLDRVRFPTPVPVGSRVRLQATVTEVTPADRGGARMHRAFTFELEGSAKPACVARALTHFLP